MNLIRYQTPRAAFNQADLMEELDRLFDAGLPTFGRAGFGAFPIDVYQDNDSVTIRAELPGFRKEDLHVNVADDTLTISGRFAAGGEQQDAPKTETSIERAIALPENLNYDKVAAAYENGILTVSLPKREEVKPKTVAVEVK